MTSVGDKGRARIRANFDPVAYTILFQFGHYLGQIKACRSIIVSLGSQRFASSPGKAVFASLTRIRELEVLEKLCERVLSAESWEALLGLPERKR